MNDLGYEYSQDGVCLNSFDRAFVHKDKHAQTKQKLHKLPSDIIIYTPEDELET